MSIRQPPAPSQRVSPEPAERAAQPPLRVLWERVLAPEASRAEVNALVRGLSRPLGEEETARERADLLLLLMEDERVGSFRGSNGQRVCAAAAQALMALGHPYALELSPEALDVMREDEREARSFVIYEDPDAPAVVEVEDTGPVVFAKRQHVGFWLAIGMALVETLFALGAGGWNSVLGLGFVAATGFGPAITLASERGVRNRLLHYICLTLMVLPSLMWLGATVAAFIFLGFGKTSSLEFMFLVPLTAGVVRLTALVCLHATPPERAPEEDLAEVD